MCGKTLFLSNLHHAEVFVCVHPGSFLDSSSALLTVAACTALGEIGRNGTLLIPAEGEGFTKLSIVDNLLARIPSGKESTKVSWETLFSDDRVMNSVSNIVYAYCL